MEKILCDKLKHALAPSYLEVVDESHDHVGHAGHRPGTPTHFRILIVSEAFEGMGALERHRRVYAILKEELNAIHALALRTLTPAEY